MPETLRTLCDVLVLVDQSAEPVVCRMLSTAVGVSWGRGRRGAAWPRARCDRLLL
jgi:hypothetical protein